MVGILGKSKKRSSVTIIRYSTMYLLCRKGGRRTDYSGSIGYDYNAKQWLPVWMSYIGYEEG